MARTFEAQSLISIPRLNGAGAYALGVAIVTAAEKKSLSQPIAVALKKVSAATDALGKALGARPAPAGSGAEARSADLAEDNAWAGLSE